MQLLFFCPNYIVVTIGQADVSVPLRNKVAKGYYRVADVEGTKITVYRNGPGNYIAVGHGR